MSSYICELSKVLKSDMQVVKTECDMRVEKSDLRVAKMRHVRDLKIRHASYENIRHAGVLCLRAYYKF